MELKSIAADRTRFMIREVEVVIGDETLRAVVRPLGLSVSTQSRLFHFFEAITGDDSNTETIEDALDVLPTALSEMVVEWDLTNNGEPIPPTRESLRGLPMDVLQVLVTSVQEAANSTPFEETSEPLSP